MTALLIPQAIIDGLLLGGIYLTIGIGFSLAFGVLHIIDFAVGEWIMLGAFIGLYLNAWTGLDPFLLLPAVFIIFGIVGYFLQPVIHQVISGKKGNPLLMGLVFTFGLGLIFRGSAQSIFGIFTHSLSTALSEDSWYFEIGPIFLTIPLVRLSGLIYALAVYFGLNFLLKKSDFGRAVRAVAQNKEAAGLMGININQTCSAVYAIYVGISAMTGVFIGAIVSLNAGMGPDLTTFAFFVVVLAGMGYLSGVPWAAFLLGLIQSFFLIYFNPSYTLLAVFFVLYLILLVSPTGMFRKGI
jgi:branched-chain amino acid transport system permease protein